MEPINERIQKLINTLGESNNRFAQRIDTSSAVISHIITGRNRPNLELVQKILRVFPNLRVSWLIMGEGDLYYSPNLPLTTDPNEVSSKSELENSNKSLYQSESKNQNDIADNENKGVTDDEPIKSEENLPGMIRQIIGSQRSMLKSMEQQMLTQERFLEWISKRYDR